MQAGLLNKTIEIYKPISITNEGVLNLLRNAKPGMIEYQIESYFDQAIKANGASDFAFNTSRWAWHYYRNGRVNDSIAP